MNEYLSDLGPLYTLHHIGIDKQMGNFSKFYVQLFGKSGHFEGKVYEKY